MNKEIKYHYGGMTVYCAVYEPLLSNMYTLLMARKALVIDPNRVGIEILTKKNVCEFTSILTHEDYDHTNGIPYVPETCSQTIICQKACADKISQEKNNRPLLALQVLAEQYGKSSEEVKNEKKAFSPYTIKADITFEKEYAFNFMQHQIRMVHTPGHTLGSCCIEVDDRFVFTGDTFLSGGPILERFSDDNRELYEQYTKSYIENLPEGSIVFPGHGEPFKLEKTGGNN